MLEVVVLTTVAVMVPVLVHAGVLGLPECHTHSEHGMCLSVECRRPQPRG